MNMVKLDEIPHLDGRFQVSITAITIWLFHIHSRLENPQNQWSPFVRWEKSSISAMDSLDIQLTQPYIAPPRTGSYWRRRWTRKRSGTSRWAPGGIISLFHSSDIPWHLGISWADLPQPTPPKKKNAKCPTCFVEKVAAVAPDCPWTRLSLAPNSGRAIWMLPFGSFTMKISQQVWSQLSTCKITYCMLVA